MSDPRHVVEAMRRVETDLQRFVARVEASVQGAERAAAQAQHELTRRRQDLERELHQAQQSYQRCERELAQAEHALAACERSGYMDRDGHYHAPDCSRYQAAVYRLRRELDALYRKIQEIETKLSTVRTLEQTLAQATSQFRSQVSRTQSAMGETVTGANYWLRERQAALSQFNLTGDLGVAVGLLVGASVALLTNAVTAARINRLAGDLGEKQGVKALKELGADRAGLGLHMGRQGLDAYGIRNTPKGRVLMRMEVKSTNNPKAGGSANEVLRRLRIGERDSYQQASRQYGMSRIQNASRQGNLMARHILASQTKTGQGRVYRSEDYVHWVNFATGEEKTFRAFSNRAGDRVNSLHLVRHILPRFKPE